MNCKIGDLAFVVESDKKSHIGVVVRIDRLNDRLTQRYGEPVWEVTFNGIIIGSDGKLLAGSGSCLDSCLRPISGVLVTDDVEDEVTA